MELNNLGFKILLILFFLLGWSCNKKVKNRILELEKENEELKLENEMLRQKKSVFQLIEEKIKHSESENNYPVESRKSLKEEEADLIQKIKKSNSSTVVMDMEIVINHANHIELFIDSINMELVEKSGGRNENGWLKTPKEKRFTNEILIDSGHATKLKGLIINGIDQMNDLMIKYDFDEEIEELPLKIDLEMENEGKLWEEYVFRNMPVGAVQPLFTKLKNDAKITKVFMLERFANKQNK